MRRQWQGGVTAVCGVAGLIAGLAIMDARVRDQLMAIAGGRAPTGEIVGATARLEALVMTAVQAARDQSIEHAPLTIFALAAALLLVFMLRT